MSTASSGRNEEARVALAAAAAYAATLFASGWVRDDRWLILENPALRGGLDAAARLLTTGYVEAARGVSPIGEYRPLLSLTFWAQLATTGARPWPFHALNVLLHAAVCGLLLRELRRRLSPHAAYVAALLFAVAPIHAEAVAYLTSRSELLVALSLLGCWRLLGAGRPPRLAPGLACFAAGLLSKEHAAVIPAFLAFSDWTFDGAAPWRRDRRPVYAGLAAVGAAWLAARWAVLGGLGAAGVPYYSTRLAAAASWPSFALRHYVAPAISGLGQCADFTRWPSGGWTPAASAALAVLLAAAAAALFGASRRRPWAFWLAGPALFLLPTCPLLVPLDTVGAERFLYIPSLAAAVGLACLIEKLPRRAATAAAAALALWYAGLTTARCRVWLSDRAYFEAALACSPSSARARVGLAAALIDQGDRPRAAALLREAAALDPALPAPSYNLSKLAWESGDLPAAEAHAVRAVALDPTSADARVMLALTREARGRLAEAAAELDRALALMPGNEAARANRERLKKAQGGRR